MKTADARKVFLLLLVLAILANTIIAAFFWNRALHRAQAAESLRLKSSLNRLRSSFSFEKVFLKKFKDLFEKAKELRNSEFSSLIAEWSESAGLVADACEIVFFKGHQPVNAPEFERDEWAFFFDRIDCGQFRKFRTAGEEKNRIVRFLNGGIGFERLEGKPGQLRKININERRSYGIWFSSPGEGSGDADGMIALVHKNKISNRLVARALFIALKVGCDEIGYLNLFAPEDSLLQKNLDPYRLKATISALDEKSGHVEFKIDGKRLIASLDPHGHVFVAFDRQITVPVPFWCLSLFFFWFPLWLNSFISTGKEFRLSLPVLLTFVVAISMALPVAAIGFYWNIFLESKRESLKISALDKLQNHLVQLDNNSLQIFRSSRHEYKALTEILDGKPQNLQRFIDRSVELELDGMYDTCMLLNAEGDFVRPTAGSTYAVRKLVFHNRAFREKTFEQFFAWGWVPFDLEASYALETPVDTVDVAEFISLMPSQGKNAYSSFASFTAKDIIRLHNSRFDGNTENLKDGVSSMVMSSFIGNDDESPVARIHQSLGDFFDFGFGVNQSLNFVDIIKDESGRAIMCMILFSGRYNYTNRFFNQVFSNEKLWPEGVKYLAITNRLFNSNFPYLDLWKRTGWLIDLMQPPRNTHVQEVMINDEPHLLCAYVGRRSQGFILAAALPLKEIELQLDGVRRRMLFAALIVAATLIFVLVRLNRGIVLPARLVMHGVRAIESRDHQHQISIDTNDEWQQLSETFNDSIESMKELEVAHFVQTCILPGADIVADSSVFAGRTVPADDVGGDYYDAFVSSSGGMTFVMGDVSGHSVSAALVVSMARAGFTALIDSGLQMPHDIFCSFNRLMLEHLRRVKMMTCFSGYVDVEGRLTCCNAGQTFPLLVKADGSVESLRIIGYPLGAARRKSFKSETIQLPEECRLVMFSDGVVEAMNDRDEPFGYERLECLVKEMGCRCSREQFFDGIYSAVRKFSGTVPWADDVTVALLDYRKKTSSA
jgi:serine phosphatase RsbU (regulator of sigma subunit)